MVDAHALKDTWAQVAKCGDEVPHFFYSHLFLSHPETRDLFPISMASQRDKLVAALGRIVSHVDELEQVTPFIQQLGRDHRRFGTVAAHYPAVGASLLATLRHFLGAAWTDEVAADWAAAYGLIARVMVEAAEESEATSPAAWGATVTHVERRTLDVAVVRLSLDQPFDYLPGQSFAMEVPQRPRLWRYYSPANAPRDDGSIEIHVQLVAGGQVSTSIVRTLRAGDTVRLGAPVGDQLTLPDHRPDLLLVAGGTGLAPLRAVLEQVDELHRTTGSGPQAHLLHGVRMPWNLYDRDHLRQLAASRPWFTYTEAVSDDLSYPGTRGLVGSVAARSGAWQGRTALVCGSQAMVVHTIGALTAAGMPAADIHYEQFTTVVSGPTADHPREGDEQ